MNVMLDINVLLDYLQKRIPYYDDASLVVKGVLQQTFTGFVPAHGLTTIYYILAKHVSRQKANQEIDWLLSRFEIAPADKTACIHARSLGIDDFEDAVVASLAVSAGCDYLITRNLSDFKNSPVSAISPDEFVKKFISNVPSTP